MTIYYFEGSPIMAPVSVETDELMFVNDSLSLKQDRISGASQRWLVSFGVVPTISFNPLATLLRGSTSSFTFNFPQFTRDLVSLTTAITVASAVYSNTVTIGTTPALGVTVGRMVKFSNHNKLYMVIAKPTATTLTVYPRLTAALTTSQTMAYGSNVPMTAYISPDQIRGLTFSDGLLEDYGTMKFVEAL